MVVTNPEALIDLRIKRVTVKGPGIMVQICLRQFESIRNILEICGFPYVNLNHENVVVVGVNHLQIKSGT